MGNSRKYFSKLSKASAFLTSIKRHLYIEYNICSYINELIAVEDEFYTKYTGTIYLEDIDTSERELIGELEFTRLSECSRWSEDVFLIFDANSFFLRFYERLYSEDKDMWLVDEIENSMNFWLMDSVVIKEEYRGNGLIQLILLDKMRKFFSCNDCIFSFAYPLQFDKRYIQDHPTSNFTNTTKPIDIKDAHNKLKKSYLDVGYKYLTDIDVQNETYKDELLMSIENEKNEDNKLIFFIYN